MKINRNNYESYFMDYLEGNLDDKMVDDFIEFLQLNPDLKEELSMLQNISLEKEEITFDKKELLYKEKYDLEKEFNEAAIAQLEGDISSSEKAGFEAYLSNRPGKQKEAELFRLTKLQPDLTVTFSKKQKLYKRTFGRSVFLWSARAAAVMIILLSVYLFVDKSSDKPINPTQIAALKEEKEPEKKVNNQVTEVPEKKDKKEVLPALKKDSGKPALQKEKPKTESTKSLRENSKGRLENEDLAMIRTTEIIPAKINRLNPDVFEGISQSDLALAGMVLTDVNEPGYEEKYLVDVLKEKTGIEKLSVNKITKAGLSIVSNLSKEKFSYETNPDGKVTELKYDSRILAFSIPTNRENAGE